MFNILMQNIFPIFYRKINTKMEKVHYLLTTLANIWLLIWIIYSLTNIDIPFTKQQEIAMITINHNEHSDLLEREINKSSPIFI